MQTPAQVFFEGRVRVRVSGLIVRDSRMLLVKIKSPTRNKPFWMPPGGGVEFGEPLESALEREMLEETGLSVTTERLMYVSEYLKGQWHAIEFYFLCRDNGGEPVLGSDPELSETDQMLKELRWFSSPDAQESGVFPVFIQEDFQRIINGEIAGPLFIRQ
jgi:8-oxo-dGTP diphosphatase